MPFCAESQLDLPDAFPAQAFTASRAAARAILVQGGKSPLWSEYGLASNLIPYRFRSATEDWSAYEKTWAQHGFGDFEVNYLRERLLFQYFAAGVSCVEATAYSFAALFSHASLLGLPFGQREQRECTPAKLADWLRVDPLTRQFAASWDQALSSTEWTSWVNFRNRLTHRSNLPRVVQGSLGGVLPAPKPLHFAATSSTPSVQADLREFGELLDWLAKHLDQILTEGAQTVVEMSGRP